MITKRLKALLAAVATSLPLLSGAFDVVDTAGKTHRLAAYQGRWVVVNFWATWCAPCVKEIPEIAAFQKAHVKDVVVLGIAVDNESAQKTRQFAAKVGHDYPLVLGDDPKIEKQFGRMKGLPTTIVFDPSGKKVYDRLGVVTKKFLDDLVK